MDRVEKEKSCNSTPTTTSVYTVAHKDLWQERNMSL